jgi:hypothetical protein
MASYDDHTLIIFSYDSPEVAAKWDRQARQSLIDRVDGFNDSSDKITTYNTDTQKAVAFTQNDHYIIIVEGIDREHCVTLLNAQLDR